MTTPTRPEPRYHLRCEATVRRWDGVNPEEPEHRDEPCGRTAKTVVQVGSRDVPTCYVHERKLRRGQL